MSALIPRLTSLRCRRRWATAFVPGLVALLLAADGVRADRLVVVQGTLLNRVDWSQDFPTGSAFSLELSINEAATDGFPNNPKIGDFGSAVRSVKVTVPASGYAISGVPGSASLKINLDADVSAPVISIDFTLGKFGTADFVTGSVGWYMDPSRPLTSDSLGQDFGNSKYRFIEAQFNRPETPGGGALRLAGFGWSRRTPSGSGGGPVPLRESGYRELFVFGDSLSASKNPNLDPTKTRLYFEGGYCNGPVWVQHLAWRMGIPYREAQNLSQFGGFRPVTTALFEGKPTGDALAVTWKNTEIYQATINLAFTGSVVAEGTAAAGALEIGNQLDLLHIAETVDSAGIRDLLVLGVADISFSPFIRSLIPDTNKLAELRSFVDISNARRSNLISSLSTLFPALRIQMIDPNAYLSQITVDPGRFGIANLDVGVVDGDLNRGIPPLADTRFDGPGAGYFFWDSISPTTRVHCHLADAIFDDVFSSGRASDNAPSLRVIGLSDTEVTLYAWNLVAGRPSMLEAAPDLRQWLPATTFTPADPCRLFHIPRAATPPHRFFRLNEP